jgi:hypothetical protein
MASDDKLSDFQLVPDQNSIETCLANVRACDQFVIVLDQRYGPVLNNFGYDVSATHLEYREAVKAHKVIHFFVRDRLVADYSIWKKNNGQEIRFSWVKDEKDHLIFQLLKEHEQKRATESNWIDTFSTSVDLKNALYKRFRNLVTPAKLAELISKNEVPILDIVTESAEINGREVIFKKTIYNRGNSPAFNLEISFKAEAQAGKSYPQKRLLTSNCSLSLNSIHRLPASAMRADRRLDDEDLVQLDYDTIHGIHVSDNFRINLKVASDLVSHNSVLQSRKYSYCEPLRIEIDES